MGIIIIKQILRFLEYFPKFVKFGITFPVKGVNNYKISNVNNKIFAE